MENIENTNDYKEKSLVDLGNIISDSDYELGRIVEIEQSAKDFRAKSGISFAADKLKEAEIYKSLAVEFEKEGKFRRDKWQSKKARRGCAYGELLERDENSVTAKEQIPA